MKDYFDSLIIGIFLIGVSGLVGWLLVVQPVREHHRIGQWDRVPATITSVKMLESPPGNENVTTYECQASYHYLVGGKTYTTSNVSIYKGSDNLSGFQQQVYQELSDHEKSGEPFLAYVNPRNPAEAVLYRNIRWGVSIGVSLLVLLFSSAGLLLIAKSTKEFMARQQGR